MIECKENNCFMCGETEKQCYKSYQQGIKDGIKRYKGLLIEDVSARAQNFEIRNEDREAEIFNNATRTFIEAMGYFEEKMKCL